MYIVKHVCQRRRVSLREKSCGYQLNGATGWKRCDRAISAMTKIAICRCTVHRAVHIRIALPFGIFRCGDKYCILLSVEPCGNRLALHMWRFCDNELQPQSMRSDNTRTPNNSSASHTSGPFRMMITMMMSQQRERKREHSLCADVHQFPYARCLNGNVSTSILWSMVQSAI